MQLRGRVMVPVPANAESGIKGPAQPCTLRPDAAPDALSFFLNAFVFAGGYL